MISIIGNVKIDETNPERIQYLLASIRSYGFLKNTCQFILCLQSPSKSLQQLVLKEIMDVGFTDFSFPDEPRITEWHSLSYGKRYCALLDGAKYDYVLNFMEDHFMVMDSSLKLFSLIVTMMQHNIDVCKTSFHRIERNSSGTLRAMPADDISQEVGTLFVNDETNFRQYQKHYGTRYYIGANFLTTKTFAYKFWNRDLGGRPHEYEITSFRPEWQHNCIIPGENFELQAPIDDDHGEPYSCLLKRDNTKFWILFHQRIANECA